MADYWKSQAKKFCDFCKCWIADNKPSIGFHESGKRHKENVAKRLAEISKNSAKSYKEELQVDQEMKKMEEEALKAYMKDLQENPDFTSKRILEEAEKKKKELDESVRQQKEGNAESASAKPQETTSSAPEESTAKVWYEAKSDEGYTYYWNVNTAESVWQPPEEGYVTLEEQEKQQKEAKLKEEMKKRKKEEEKARKKEEITALQERENNKKKRKKIKKDEEEAASAVVGPAPKADPYGAWTVIEPKVEEPLDLELPQQEFVAIKVPELTEPEIKFKEKACPTWQEDEEFTIKKETDESTEGSGGFKKRKFKGNMRQKLDTD